jgi:hypothetical protein
MELASLLKAAKHIKKGHLFGGAFFDFSGCLGNRNFVALCQL